MIPGFHDDEIFNVFSPYLTVWPLAPKDGKLLDFNVAKIELLAALVTPYGRDVEDTIVDRIEDRRAEGAVVSKPQELDDLIQSQDSMTRQIRSKLFNWKTQLYKVNVRGVSGKVERTYQMILAKNPAAVDNLRQSNKQKEAAASSPAGGGNEGSDGKVQTSPAGGGSILDSQKLPLKIVYQRFL
jgi:hypothetical protein